MAKTKKNQPKLHTAITGKRWWQEVGWRHIVGVLAVIYCLVPLIYVVSVALTPRATLTGGLFKNFQFSTMFENFTALGAGKYSVFWSWILNSLIVSAADPDVPADAGLRGTVPVAAGPAGCIPGSGSELEARSDLRVPGWCAG